MGIETLFVFFDGPPGGQRCPGAGFLRVAGKRREPGSHSSPRSPRPLCLFPFLLLALTDCPSLQPAQLFLLHLKVSVNTVALLKFICNCWAYFCLCSRIAQHQWPVIGLFNSLGPWVYGYTMRKLFRESVWLLFMSKHFCGRQRTEHQLSSPGGQRPWGALAWSFEEVLVKIKSESTSLHSSYKQVWNQDL